MAGCTQFKPFYRKALIVLLLCVVVINSLRNGGCLPNHRRVASSTTPTRTAINGGLVLHDQTTFTADDLQNRRVYVRIVVNPDGSRTLQDARTPRARNVQLVLGQQSLAGNLSPEGVGAPGVGGVPSISLSANGPTVYDRTTGLPRGADLYNNRVSFQIHRNANNDIILQDARTRTSAQSGVSTRAPSSTSRARCLT